MIKIIMANYMRSKILKNILCIKWLFRDFWEVSLVILLLERNWPIFGNFLILSKKYRIKISLSDSKDTAAKRIES